ncbi:hypothetical protein EDD21DRAFT_449164 [Dissophora ornata]|nr:hypothetical protein EDD21DRAFT_449164 [Dissophora ornata]
MPEIPEIPEPMPLLAEAAPIPEPAESFLPTPPTSSEPAEHQKNNDESPSSPARSSPSSSPGTSSPIIYSPLLHSPNVTIPVKPTRRPPPSPHSDSSSTDTIDTVRHSRGTIGSPNRLPLLSESPLEQNHHPLMESSPPSPPPLPPKPARYRKVMRNSEDLSPDEDSSDDDEDEDEDEAETPEDLQPLSNNLIRKTSSPNIAIPQQRRRLGSSASEPVSPSHSPPNIPSSCPGSQSTARSFSQSSYPLLLRNNSSTCGLVAVIPEGCVDPSNLVEAERINGDDEDDLKTYGPADHLPMIPISPLRTTHRSLVEKEKSWSSMLAETKHQIQELWMRVQQDDYSEDAEQTRYEDRLKIDTLQEDARKHTSQVSNIMATIIKVRELLYRSAGITSILEFPPYLIAYQLTLVESAIFLEISSDALLTHSAKNPHHSITASTDFFNYLTRMIEYSILFPAEASGRALIINHWIKVAVKLHELENFQTLKAVLCAFGTPPIKRLKRTWGFLPRKSIGKMETLSELMSEDRNYGKYREMMNSICAGTIIPSPDVSSPVLPDSASGSRFDILGSWNGSEIKSKEVARRPVIPFLGTFIMDVTYLLAAVKKSSAQGASAPALVAAAAATPLVLAKVPATSSLRVKNLTVNTAFCPQDDSRIQDLIQTLNVYQSGPRYSPQPSRSYIKAAMKSQNHFRTPSLSSALQITTKYRNANAAADRQLVFDDEDDDLLVGSGGSGVMAGSGGIRSTQQLILHYLLTRPWAPERMVDELSMIREPSKSNSGSNNGGSGGGGGYNGGNSKSSSISSWSGISIGGGGSGNSLYSHSSSSTSIDPHTSTGSSESSGGLSSRPTSMEEE